MEKVVFCVKHGDGHKEEVPGPRLLLSIFQGGLLFIKEQTATFSEGQN